MASEAEADQRIYQGFIRQRRALFIISLLLIGIDFLGVSIPSEIKIFNTGVPINRPNNVNIGLWIFLIYFVIRYYQYFRKIRSKGYRLPFRNKMSNYLYGVTFECIKKNPDKYLNKHPSYKTHKEFVETEAKTCGIRKEKFGYYDVTCTINIAKPLSVASMDVPVRINFLDLIWPRIRAFTFVSFNTPYFTEYIFPFVMTGIAIAYKIFSILMC